MSVKAFVDTNVFVYAALQDSDSQQKRMASIAVLSGSHRIVVSTQVLNLSGSNSPQLAAMGENRLSEIPRCLRRGGSFRTSISTTA